MNLLPAHLVLAALRTKETCRRGRPGIATGCFQFQSLQHNRYSVYVETGRGLHTSTVNIVCLSISLVRQYRWFVNIAGLSISLVRQYRWFVNIAGSSISLVCANIAGSLVSALGRLHLTTKTSKRTCLIFDELCSRTLEHTLKRWRSCCTELYIDILMIFIVKWNKKQEITQIPQMIEEELSVIKTGCRVQLRRNEWML